MTQIKPGAIKKVKVATFSLSASSPDGDDTPYLEWHQLDHMPEQYQIPGLLFAHRWASTPECRAARAVQAERFEPTNHVVHYLFGEPVAPAIDEWFTLGAHLGKVGRFPYRLPAVMLAVGDLVAGYAAPSALVTAEVVPYRPNRGMYLVVELPDDPSAPPAWAPEHVEALLDIDGVAGMWTFTAKRLATRPLRYHRVQHHRVLPRRRPGRSREADRRRVGRALGAHPRHSRARGAVRDDARVGVGPLRPPGLNPAGHVARKRGATSVAKRCSSSNTSSRVGTYISTIRWSTPMSAYAAIASACA